MSGFASEYSFIPVSGTDITSIVGWYAATVDDDPQDHESNTCDDLHEAENELDLASFSDENHDHLVTYLPIASDSKILDDGQGEKQRYDPSAVVDIFHARPVVYNLAGVRLDPALTWIILTLQAAEISKGSTVSQPMPYCHPQANPHEGSMNLQMYMVKAPLIGYMTANSASACVIRYLKPGCQKSIHTKNGDFKIPYIMPPVANTLDLYINIDCAALTNDHEADEHGGRSSSLEGTPTAHEETCTNSTSTEVPSAHDPFKLDFDTWAIP